jgi:hypothetical protein
MKTQHTVSIRDIIEVIFRFRKPFFKFKEPFLNFKQVFQLHPLLLSLDFASFVAIADFDFHKSLELYLITLPQSDTPQKQRFVSH